MSTPKTPQDPQDTSATKPAKSSGTRDNTVRTRQATEAERAKGARIDVGKATEVKPDAKPSEDGDGDGSKTPQEKKAAVAAATGTKAPVTGPPEGDGKAPPMSLQEQHDAAAEADRLKSKRQAAFDKAAASDPAAKKTTTAKEKTPGKFTDNIKAAVKYARYEVAGQNPKLKADAHRPAASAGQHMRVRTHIVQTLTNEATAKVFAEKGYQIVPGDKRYEKVTPESILKLTGIASQKKLREIAEFSTGTGTEDLKPLQQLGEAFKGDSWAQGRWLAGILVAWVEEIKADTKAATKAAKASATKPAKSAATATA